VAIVTGGGAAGDGIGNGRAAAMLLARAGCRVLVVDRKADLAEGSRPLDWLADYDRFGWCSLRECSA
jgi:NAD(P)-dependent dehydrogenase (short-subunit alcohol dehydrogenase family)